MTLALGALVADDHDSVVKSSPPKCVSPAMAFTSKMPSSVVSTHTSKVPSPKSSSEHCVLRCLLVQPICNHSCCGRLHCYSQTPRSEGHSTGSPLPGSGHIYCQTSRSAGQSAGSPSSGTSHSTATHQGPQATRQGHLLHVLVECSAIAKCQGLKATRQGHIHCQTSRSAGHSAGSPSPGSGHIYWQTSRSAGHSAGSPAPGSGRIHCHSQCQGLKATRQGHIHANHQGLQATRQGRLLRTYGQRSHIQ